MKRTGLFLAGSKTQSLTPYNMIARSSATLGVACSCTNYYCARLRARGAGVVRTSKDTLVSRLKAFEQGDYLSLVKGLEAACKQERGV